jgi:hypothetical protein
MKRMPKETHGNFRVIYWVETRFGGQVKCAMDYATRAEAELARDIAKTHKTKSSVQLIEKAVCTDDTATIERRKERGGFFCQETATWKYSASY